MARICVFFLAFFCASAAFSQDASCLHRAVTVTVTDKAGAPVTGLTAADFQVEFRGKSVQIQSVSDVQAPQRVLIALDTSASMQGTTGVRWTTATAVAGRFIGSRFPNTSLALFVFGEDTNLSVPFSKGNDAVANQVQKIQDDSAYVYNHVKGPKNLPAAITEAVKFFDSPRAGDVIFVITDDGADLDKQDSNRLRELAEANGIRLFFCVLTMDRGTGPLDKSRADVLGFLAQDTGGFYIGPVGGESPNPVVDSGGMMLSPTRQLDAVTRPDTKSALYPSFSDRLPPFYRHIVNSRQVVLVLSAPVDKPDKLKVSLSKEASKRNKGAQVDFPHELVPCSVGNSH